MKQTIKKTKGLIKGAPTAVVVSAAIHIALLAVAGGFVVFSVIKKPEKKFEPPPPVERRKIELKKPKVKVKKQARPKASQRIVSKSVQGMSNLQLPSSTSMGEGLSGGIGGFELMPDISELSLFGGRNSAESGNDFEGTFFSLAYDYLGCYAPITREKVWDTLQSFYDNGWNLRTFAPYYKSPNKLYTTHFMIPPMISYLGPTAFGIYDTNFHPVDWIVYYKGKIASRKTGRYRFWGMGDELIVVRINKKTVFDGTWSSSRDSNIRVDVPAHEKDLKYYLGNSGAYIGTWFDLQAETPVEMEVLMEDNGGEANFYILVEEEGVYYPRNEQGMPILPAFKTAEFSEAIKARIEYSLMPGEADLDSDLMFNVY